MIMEHLTDQILEILAPVVVSLLTILIPAAGALVVRLFKKAGLDVEARQREAFQTALRNAALLSIGMGMGKAGQIAAVEYVRQSAGDAAKSFGLSDEDIAAKLAPHVTAAALTARNPLTKLDAVMDSDTKAAVIATLHATTTGGNDGGGSS